MDGAGQRVILAHCIAGAARPSAPSCRAP